VWYPYSVNGVAIAVPLATISPALASLEPTGPGLLVESTIVLKSDELDPEAIKVCGATPHGEVVELLLIPTTTPVEPYFIRISFLWIEDVELDAFHGELTV
jgi:hypothetical protein